MLGRHFKIREWPILVSAIFAAPGVFLLTSSSLKETVLFDVPMYVLGGFLLLIGCIFLVAWLFVHFLKGFIYLARNYRDIPLIFKLKSIQQVEREMQAREDRINNDLANIEKLVKSQKDETNS